MGLYTFRKAYLEGFLLKVSITNKRVILGAVNFTQRKVEKAEDELGILVARDLANQLKNALGSSITERGYYRGYLKESITARDMGNETYEIYMRFYGLFLERGTRGSSKKAPPALVKWVEKKLGVPADNMKTSQRVANSIRKKGTKALPFISQTISNYDPNQEMNAFSASVEI